MGGLREHGATRAHLLGKGRWLAWIVARLMKQLLRGDGSPGPPETDADVAAMESTRTLNCAKPEGDWALVGVVVEGRRAGTNERELIARGVAC